MKKFMESIFFDRESWWGFWKAVMGCAVMSAVITVLFVAVIYVANGGSVEACAELQGDLTARGFNCLLPSGEIVEPIRYLESN